MSPLPAVPHWGPSCLSRSHLHIGQAIFSSPGQEEAPLLRQTRGSMPAADPIHPCFVLISVYKLQFIYQAPKQSRSLMYHNHSATVPKAPRAAAIGGGVSAERKFPSQCCLQISWILHYRSRRQRSFRFPAVQVLHGAHFSLPLGNQCFHKLRDTQSSTLTLWFQLICTI